MLLYEDHRAVVYALAFSRTAQHWQPERKTGLCCSGTCTARSSPFWNKDRKALRFTPSLFSRTVSGLSSATPWAVRLSARGEHLAHVQPPGRDADHLPWSSRRLHPSGRYWRSVEAGGGDAGTLGPQGWPAVGTGPPRAQRGPRGWRFVRRRTWSPGRPATGKSACGTFIVKIRWNSPQPTPVPPSPCLRPDRRSRPLRTGPPASTTWRSVMSGPVLKGHKGQVTAIALSPDGQSVATGSSDCTVRLWTPPPAWRRRASSGRSAGLLARLRAGRPPPGRRRRPGVSGCLGCGVVRNAEWLKTGKSRVLAQLSRLTLL